MFLKLKTLLHNFYSSCISQIRSAKSFTCGILSFQFIVFFLIFQVHGIYDIGFRLTRPQSFFLKFARLLEVARGQRARDKEARAFLLPNTPRALLSRASNQQERGLGGKSGIVIAYKH